MQLFLVLSTIQEILTKKDFGEANHESVKKNMSVR